MQRLCTVFNIEQVVTWFAVLMRFWVRLRIMREPGWDDALVLLAAILNTVATALVITCKWFGGMRGAMMLMNRHSYPVWLGSALSLPPDTSNGELHQGECGNDARCEQCRLMVIVLLLGEFSLHQQHRCHQALAFDAVPAHLQGRDDELGL